MRPIRMLYRLKDRTLPHLYRVMFSTRSKRTIRFRKYIILILLLTATIAVYFNIAVSELGYLSTPIVINTEDVTGVTKLSTDMQRAISVSNFNLPEEDGLEKIFKIGSKTFDPRLMPALLMAKLTRMIKSNDLDTEIFQVPFSWSDWLDLDVKLKASEKWYNYFNRKDFTCDTFKKYYKIKGDLKVCKPLDPEDIGKGFPQFKIVNYDDRSFLQEARAIMGASYLKFSAPPPHRLIFLGADRQNRGALIVPTLRNPLSSGIVTVSRNQSLIESLEFISNEVKTTGKSRNEVIDAGIMVSEQTDLFSRAAASSNLDFHQQVDDFNITKDIVRIVNYDKDDGQQIVIPKSDFILDVDALVKDMKRKVSSSGRRDVQNLDYILMKTIKSLLPRSPNFDKFFHESAIIGRPVAGQHYDWRFFNRLDIPYYEHVAILHRTIRAWLRFSRATGITTWIAHGTMLSWYWNGINMPWDTDADVQVTAASLLKLARNYENSLITDLTKEESSNIEEGISSSQGIGKFLLDVGPSFFSRVKGNGQNAIDARFIDTKTGLYIDITALAFTDFNHNDNLEPNKHTEFLQLMDPDFLTKIDSKSIDKAKYDRELLAKQKAGFDKKEIYNCRNNHYYSLDELSPLLPTLYEGAKAYVPHGFKQILSREYKKGLTNLEFWGHSYRPHLRLWIKNDVCPDDKEGDQCSDSITLSEFKQTQSYTAQHADEMAIIANGDYVGYRNSDEFAPLRIDPWFIRHIKKTAGFLRNKVDYDNAA